MANFAPMKAKYKERIDGFRSQYPDLKIDQSSFGRLFMPIYYEAMSTENTIAGFRKCGLHPWDSSAPNYSKIRPRALQLGHDYAHCIGVNKSKLVLPSSLSL